MRILSTRPFRPGGVPAAWPQVKDPGACARGRDLTRGHRPDSRRNRLEWSIEDEVFSWVRVADPLVGSRLRGWSRIVSTPHSTGWGHDGLITKAEDRLPGPQGGRRLRVGDDFRLGLGGSGQRRLVRVDLPGHERNDDALRTLATRVHEQGALIMSQMTHMGRRGTPLMSGVPLRAVSDLPEGVHREVPVVLSTAEISGLVERFADAARRLMVLAGMVPR